MDENIIYTTRKCDAKASDQVFMFSNKLRKIWWNNLNFFLTEKSCPEYEIFNNLPEKVTIQNGPCFYGGLLRNQENNLKFWDTPSIMKYQDKYNLEISKDTNFENKYKDMLLKSLNYYNFDFIYIDKLITRKQISVKNLLVKRLLHISIIIKRYIIRLISYICGDIHLIRRAFLRT